MFSSARFILAFEIELVEAFDAYLWNENLFIWVSSEMSHSLQLYDFKWNLMFISFVSCLGKNVNI